VARVQKKFFVWLAFNFFFGILALVFFGTLAVVFLNASHALYAKHSLPCYYTILSLSLSLSLHHSCYPVIILSSLSDSLSITLATLLLYPYLIYLTPILILL